MAHTTAVRPRNISNSLADVLGNLDRAIEHAEKVLKRMPGSNSVSMSIDGEREMKFIDNKIVIASEVESGLTLDKFKIIKRLEFAEWIPKFIDAVRATEADTIARAVKAADDIEDAIACLQQGNHLDGY